jgi:hypothetical protein
MAAFCGGVDEDEGWDGGLLDRYCVVLVNPKPETRNPNECFKPEIRNNAPVSQASASDFGHSNFVLVSGFGFRV